MLPHAGKVSIYNIKNKDFGWTNQTYEISLNDIKFQYKFVAYNKCEIWQKTDISLIPLTDEFIIEPISNTKALTQDITQNGLWPSYLRPDDTLPNSTFVGFSDGKTMGKINTSFSNTAIMIHGFEFFDADNSGNFKGMRFTGDNDIRPQWPFVYPDDGSPLITEFDISASSWYISPYWKDTSAN